MNEVSFDPAKHEYREDGIVLPHATKLLAEEGFYKGSDFFTEEGRIFGTYAHHACQFHDEGTLEWEGLDEQLANCVRSYILFRETTEFIPELIEKPLSCALGVAGTPDRWGKFPDGKTVLIDLKTGKPAIADPYQTAIYQLILEANGYNVDIRGSLYLQRDGRIAKWKPHTLRSDFAVAHSLITVHNVKKQGGII